MLQGDNEYICPSGSGLVFVLNWVGFCLYMTQNRTLVLECEWSMLRMVWYILAETQSRKFHCSRLILNIE